MLFTKPNIGGGLFRPKQVRGFFTKTVPRIAGKVEKGTKQVRSVIKTLEKVPGLSPILETVDELVSGVQTASNVISKLKK